MKEFSTITSDRLRELVFAAGYKTSYPEGNPAVITDETLSGYARFGQAVADDLKAGTDVENIMLERFSELAKDKGGFQPYDMFADPSGTVDTMKLIASGAQELLYVRIAYQIAEELKK